MGVLGFRAQGILGDCRIPGQLRVWGLRGY